MTEKINIKTGYDADNALSSWIQDLESPEPFPYEVAWSAARAATTRLRSWLGPWTQEDYASYVQDVETDHPGLTPLDYGCWVKWRRSSYDVEDGWGHRWYSYRDDLVDSALRGGHIGPKTTSDDTDDWHERYVSHYPDNCRCTSGMVFKHTVENGCGGATYEGEIPV